MKHAIVVDQFCSSSPITWKEKLKTSKKDRYRIEVLIFFLLGYFKGRLYVIMMF